ncbi:hypothetical protein ACSFV5_07160 [Acinetobacter sp. HC8-3S]
MTKFFNENKALIKTKLWSVNIPEEPDSASILHPVPSQKIGKQLVHRLKQEALQQFPTVGKSIAEAVALEVWEGTEAEHAEYLKTNPNWWLHTTFWRIEMVEKANNERNSVKPLCKYSSNITAKVKEE